jgi:quercetin dioxygenase-like cupin family protein
MTFIDTAKLPVVERKPGWRGRYFDSANMTFGHYEFDAGATIHAHSHEQEEVWQVIEGELEVTIAGRTLRAGPGTVAIVPPDTEHKVVALTSGKAIVVDWPLRAMPKPAA